MATAKRLIYFKILIFLYTLFTSATWFTMHTSNTPLVGTMNVLMLLSLIPVFPQFRFTRSVSKAVVALFMIFIWFTMIKGIVFGTFISLKLLPAIYLFLLSKEQKQSVLLFCTKWYAGFLLISILIFAITSSVKLPPPLGIFMSRDTEHYPPFLNYFFYIRPLYEGEFAGTMARFNAFWLEPGHMAISTIFFLVANKLDFGKKWYMWTMLICILVSLSLAGYVLLAIAWILFKSRNIKGLIATAIIGLVIVVVSQGYNDGNNYVNSMILSRLEMDKEKGIEGNNRTNAATDDLFNRLFSNGTILTGDPNAENLTVFGAGYKKYLILYGLIAAVITFFFYWELQPPGCSKMYALGFFILIFLTWCDCEYPTWFTWLLPYILGIGTSGKLKVT